MKVGGKPKSFHVKTTTGRVNDHKLTWRCHEVCH